MSTPPRTIPEALLATAARGAGEYVFHLDGGEQRLSCADVAERAERGARRLIARGVEPGDAVGVLGPNHPEWVVWAFATWIAGAVLVPVQIPLRVRDPEAFAARLRNLAETAGCKLVVADPRLAGVLPEGVAVTWEETGDLSGEDPVAPAASDAAVIQFTSGSTAEPKGALLTQAAVMAQMELLRRGYRFEDGTPRSVLSWTPFFHDLGLFANLVHPAFSGSLTHHLPTERFARDPTEWLRLVERTRVDATVGPSSAFGSAIRTASRRGERIDLGSLDAAYFAAEGVDPDVARRMVDDAQTFNFDPKALGATYGLAEAVLGVAYPFIGSGLRIEAVGLEELATAGVAAPAADGSEPTRLMISCGPPLMDLRILGEDGVLPDRHVGEIQVRGASLMSGYVGRDAPDPFVDGWLRTGDLGYVADGELYVTGRAKDLVIAMGQNYYPEDFEWAAARVAAVRPGRCVAFAKPGSEEVVLLVEPIDGADHVALGREVKRSVADSIGVAPSEVVVVPRGTVEKTTSGKLRRAAMRDTYVEGALSGSASSPSR